MNITRIEQLDALRKLRAGHPLTSDRRNGHVTIIDFKNEDSKIGVLVRGGATATIDGMTATRTPVAIDVRDEAKVNARRIIHTPEK